MQNKGVIALAALAFALSACSSHTNQLPAVGPQSQERVVQFRTADGTVHLATHVISVTSNSVTLQFNDARTRTFSNVVKFLPLISNAAGTGIGSRTPLVQQPMLIEGGGAGGTCAYGTGDVTGFYNDGAGSNQVRFTTGSAGEYTAVFFGADGTELASITFNYPANSPGALEFDGDLNDNALTVEIIENGNITGRGSFGDC